MRIVGIKVGSRSALTAKRDGTVIWNPPIDVPTHNFPWSNVAPNNRVQTKSDLTIRLRSSTTIDATTLLATVTNTRHRGTILEGPIYNVDNGFWWYRILWDDASLPNLPTNQGCWVGADNLETAVENRAPVANTQVKVATVGTPISITLTGSDADGDTLTYAVTVSPTKGTLSGTAPNLTYTPTTEGVDGFSFRVNDGVLDSEPAIVEITNSAVTPPTPDIPTLLSRAGWSIHSYSSQEMSGENAPATAAIDGNNSTFWHSEWSGAAVPPPHFIAVNLGVARDVMGIRYLPRQDGDSNGLITNYQIHTSLNGTDWILQTSGTWVADASEKEVLITKHSAQYVKLTAVDDQFATVATLGVLVPQTDPNPPPPVDPPDTPPTTDPVYLSSITRHGVTWAFDKAYPCGQYANGDWWVVGPVTITSITPETANDQSGTMINPSPGRDNGWDSRIKYGQYSSALNIAKSLPMSVAAGSSVMSSVSFATLATADNPQLETIAILTVVASAPPAGSFRPPYIGTDKTHRWNESQLNYSLLRSLSPTNNAPSLSVVENYFVRPWIEKTGSWTGRYFHPYLNHPFQARGTVGTYGREMAHTAADGLLMLQLNYTNAQKRTLLIRLVQAGIDIYGAAKGGARWGDGGGHNQGRKMLLLLAGTVLNDTAILEYGDAARRRIFQEDLQTFYVTESDVGRPLTGVNGAAVGLYTESHVGMAEWGTNHWDQPQYDNALWTCPYRIVAGPCTTGHILTARLMGLESKWNHPAAFDYFDRFFGIEGGNASYSTNAIQPFVAEMWSAYRNS